MDDLLSTVAMISSFVEILPPEAVLLTRLSSSTQL